MSAATSTRRQLRKAFWRQHRHQFRSIPASKGRGTGTSKRELIAHARRETGRLTMRWKATRKYMRRLDRRGAL